jgi:thiamine pyrophosphate-dependent acetolactate synthase large subunit-like protein
MFPEDFPAMRNEQQVTVGCAIAAFLEQCGVKAAFGVISIHNMPILDAMGERGKIRFVMARGEAGANMADAYARTTGSLGVCLTSTGTAGQCRRRHGGSLTAGTPLLHITGQIETPYLDQSLAYIHEAPDQLTMLKAVSKAPSACSAETAISTIKLAVQTALTAPTGPVSVEIPIDIQAALIRCRRPEPLPVPQHQPSARARCAGRALCQGQASAAVAGRRRAPRRRAGQAPDGPGLRRGHPRRAAASCRGRSALAGRLQPAQAGRGVLPDCDAMLVVGRACAATRRSSTN